MKNFNFAAEVADEILKVAEIEGNCPVWNGTYWEHIKLIDTLGVVYQPPERQKVLNYKTYGHILSSVEIQYKGETLFLSLDIVDRWGDDVYKDGYIEIADAIYTEIGRNLFGFSLIDEVETWVQEEAQARNMPIDDVVSELLQYGCISGNVEHLIKDSDIELFYSIHHKEIDEIAGDIPEIHLRVWEAFEDVATDYSIKLDEEA